MMTSYVCAAKRLIKLLPEPHLSVFVETLKRITEQHSLPLHVQLGRAKVKTQLGHLTGLLSLSQYY